MEKLKKLKEMKKRKYTFLFNWIFMMPVFKDHLLKCPACAIKVMDLWLCMEKEAKQSRVDMREDWLSMEDEEK